MFDTLPHFERLANAYENSQYRQFFSQKLNFTFTVDFRIRIFHKKIVKFKKLTKNVDHKNSNFDQAILVQTGFSNDKRTKTMIKNRFIKRLV